MRRVKRDSPSTRSNGRRAPRLVRWVRCRCAELFGAEEDGANECRKSGDDSGGSAQAIIFEAVNVTKGQSLAARVEWAGTSDTRRRGLLGRDHIDRDEGAYIVPTQWIHMFGMQFPIDVAFLDSKGRVLHVCHALQPNRLSPIVWRAEGALELAAGTLESTRTEVGDVIEIR